MTAAAAKEIFGADIIEYAGVAEAKHQCQTQDGLNVDLVFSQYDNVPEVLRHFDLGICRVAWDGDFIVTDDFEIDLLGRTITTFYPSPSGHRDRVLAKLELLGFMLAAPVKAGLAYLRELADRQGYRLMHRYDDQYGNGKYWLMRNQPLTLEDVARHLNAEDLYT